VLTTAFVFIVDFSFYIRQSQAGGIVLWQHEISFVNVDKTFRGSSTDMSVALQRNGFRKSIGGPTWPTWPPDFFERQLNGTIATTDFTPPPAPPPPPLSAKELDEFATVVTVHGAKTHWGADRTGLSHFELHDLISHAAAELARRSNGTRSSESAEVGSWSSSSSSSSSSSTPLGRAFDRRRRCCRHAVRQFFYGASEFKKRADAVRADDGGSGGAWTLFTHRDCAEECERLQERLAEGDLDGDSGEEEEEPGGVATREEWRQLVLDPRSLHHSSSRGGPEQLRCVRGRDDRLRALTKEQRFNRQALAALEVYAQWLHLRRGGLARVSANTARFVEDLGEYLKNSTTAPNGRPNPSEAQQLQAALERYAALQSQARIRK
jgi:hypothetical protein